MTSVNIHHIGIWVEDMDEMISFLTEAFGFNLVYRDLRSGPGTGKKAIIHVGDNQILELGPNPNVQPRPDFPVHPTSHVVGIPHICFRATDLPEMEAKIKSLGFTLSMKTPVQGYRDFMLGSLRAILFTGPGGVDFELIECKEEFPSNSLQSG